MVEQKDSGKNTVYSWDFEKVLTAFLKMYLLKELPKQ